jgi:hypothetical protein
MKTPTLTMSFLLLPTLAAGMGCRANAQESAKSARPSVERQSSDEPALRRSASGTAREDHEPVTTLRFDVVTRNLTALPAGWSQPFHDRQYRRIVGAARACVVEVLLDDTKHLRVVRDGIPGPSFDDIQLKTLVVSPIDGRVAYIGTRGDNAFVCSSTGAEFAVPRADAANLAIADTTGLLVAVLSGIRGPKGSQLYVDGKLVLEATFIQYATLAPDGRQWAATVREQVSEKRANMYLLTSMGRGPDERSGFISTQSWSPDCRRIAYLTGDASVVTFDGTETVRWTIPGGYVHVVPGSVQFSPDSRDLAWMAGTQLEGFGSGVFVNGKRIDVPADESVLVVQTEPRLGSSGSTTDPLSGILSLLWSGEPPAPLFRTHIPNQRVAVRRGTTLLLEGYDGGSLVRSPVTHQVHWLTERREATRPVSVWKHEGIEGLLLEHGHGANMRFSPDGKHFVYSARLAGAVHRTLVVDGKACAGPNVTFDTVVFSPDSLRLAYHSESGISVVELGAEGPRVSASFPREQGRSPGDQRRYGRKATGIPEFTSDSKHIAYTVSGPDGNELCVDDTTLSRLGAGPLRPDPKGEQLYDTGQVRNPRPYIEVVAPCAVRVLHMFSADEILETVATLTGD